MSQRFSRCAHCGLPHPIEDTACSITGRPLDAARRSARPPERKASVANLPQQKVPSSRPAANNAPIPSLNIPTGESVPPPPPLIGQLLGGKYRAIRVLGEGGMGAVYECEHIALHRKVAVKVLHPAQARKKASVQRFHHEAQVAGAIGHPNICEIYDIGELDDGSPFLVMELLLGQTLADRVASEGALPFDDVVEVITQVLSGLIAAHDKGIIHRDIKPENVFLASRIGIGPLAKLLDFGISKVAGGEDLHLTRTGMVMGTPYYMSPEQARGDRALDHRVDIYATGVMMYECLSGRRPFTAANYNALLVQILTTSPRPLRELRPAIPEGFEECVVTSMNRDREKRYRNATEMQRTLTALRDPVGQRRMTSVAPEPISLVNPKNAKGPLSTDKQRRVSNVPLPPKMPAMPAPSEAPITEFPISVNLEAVGADDSGSIEIPIVAEEPRPATASNSRPLYRPPTEAGTSRSTPPVSRPMPRSGPLPPKAANVVAGPPPVPRSLRKTSRLATPPPQPVDAALVAKATQAARQATPPRPPAPRPAPTDAPWLDAPIDDGVDEDPTQIGAIPQHVQTPVPRRIDPDQTERIDPSQMHMPRSERRPAREVHAASVATRDPRREDPPENPSPEDDSEEVPTTLFDRRSVPQPPRPKAPSTPPRANTTERAPAQDPPTGKPPAQFPRR